LNERLIRNIAATFPVSGNIVTNLKSLNNELNRHRGIAAIPGVRRQGVHKRPIRRRGAQQGVRSQGPRRQRRAIERPRRQQLNITPSQLANVLNMVTIVPPKNKSLENVMRRLRIRR